MNTFEKFVYWLQGTMETPTVFGWYHIMCLGILVALCFAVGFISRKASDKTVRIVLLITTAILLIFEVIKQVVFAFEYNDGVVTWDYSWYAFPFQFCSVPMYVGFLASLLKECKLREGLYTFLGTYSLFAGLSVMIFPASVYMSYVAINIHTMLHHGAMVVLGVMLWTSGRIPFTLKAMLKAVLVFVALASIALVMNFIFYAVKPGVEFNMFFISPYYECEIPVANLIHHIYWLFLPAYFIVFTVIAFVVFYIVFLIRKFICKKTATVSYEL